MPQVIKNILIFIVFMLVYGVLSKATACDQAIPIAKNQVSPCKGVLLPEKKEEEVRAKVFELQKQADKVPLLEQKAEILHERSVIWESEAKKQALEAERAEKKASKAALFGASISSILWIILCIL